MLDRAAVREKVFEYFRWALRRGGLGKNTRDVENEARDLAGKYISHCMIANGDGSKCAKFGGIASHPAVNLPKVRDAIIRYSKEITTGRCNPNDGGSKSFEYSVAICMWAHLARYNILPFSSDNAPAFDAASVKFVNWRDGGEIIKVSHLSLEEVSKKLENEALFQYTLLSDTTSIANKIRNSYETAEKHIHKDFCKIDTIETNFIFYERNFTERTAMSLCRKYKNMTIWNLFTYIDPSEKGNHCYIPLPYGGRYKDYPIFMARHLTDVLKASSAAAVPFDKQIAAIDQNLVKLAKREPVKRKRTILDHYGGPQRKENTMIHALRNMYDVEAKRLKKLREDTISEVNLNKYYSLDYVAAGLDLLDAAWGEKRGEHFTIINE